MGFFRGGFVLVLGVLLFLSFLALNSFFILQSSLKYDNVKDSLYPFVKNLSESGTGGIIQKEVLGEFNLTKVARDNANTIKNYCQSNTEYVFSYESYTVTIPCSANVTDVGVVINETFNDVIYEIYYKQYDCKFWNCFVKTKLPFFLVSQKARDYWKNKFYISLIASLILIALIFLFIEEKRNTPIAVGTLLALSAFSMLKLEDLAYSLAGGFSELIKIFLSNTQKVFVLSLALGIVLVLTGIALRLLGSDYMKEKFSKKEIKDIVKEEITQEKQKETKTKGKKKK
ncbi:MAG: hypothetical protein AABX50_01440 [Nanoarchaeota archaeon]